jgi:voltage-gated potassium channel
MVLLERRRHKHDVIADTQCRVCVLDSEELARLAHRHPEIVRHIKQVTRERQRENEKVRGVARTARAKTAAKKKTEAH